MEGKKYFSKGLLIKFLQQVEKIEICNISATILDISCKQSTYLLISGGVKMQSLLSPTVQSSLMKGHRVQHA